MTREDVANLTRIAIYLKVTPGKLDINKENVISRSAKSKTQSGYASIVAALARESKLDTFASSDLLQQCLISQWFDYAVLFVRPAASSKAASEAVLHELNDYLLVRSYLVGQSLTLADVVLFYSLHDIVNSLSSAAKENFQNVARWFNHLQSNKSIRQSLPQVNLTNSVLHSWASGTHI